MSRNEDDPSPNAEPGLPVELARAVDGGRAPDLDGMFRALRADIEHERGVRGWLRERSTAARLLTASALIAGICAFVALAFARRDLAAYPMERMALSLAAMGLLMVVSLMIALRPLQRPGLPSWAGRLAVGGSLLLLAALYLVAPLEPAQVAFDAAVLKPALKCLGIGLALGVPVYSLIVLLDRGGARRALPMAAAAGLAANLVLHLHCPSTQPAHMMLGHFGAAALLLLAVALWARARD